MTQKKTPEKKFDRLTESIGFAIVMSLFYIIKDLISLDSYPAMKVIKLVAVDLIVGAVAGFLYGWVMSLYFRRVHRKNNALTKD